jgi:crossover junction endodeoxyribonuclease RuvC
MFVVGIDPGLSRCGYGAVVRERGGLRAVAAGVITTPPDEELPARLAALAGELGTLFAELAPDAVAVERVLFQANARTAMGVGQASGLALAAAAESGAAVFQYSPNEVKLAVVGYGAATKAQMQAMVQAILALPRRPEPPDAADALALAICHLGGAALASRVGRVLARSPAGVGAPSEGGTK